MKLLQCILELLSMARISYFRKNRLHTKIWHYIISDGSLESLLQRKGGITYINRLPTALEIFFYLRSEKVEKCRVFMMKPSALQR